MGKLKMGNVGEVLPDVLISGLKVVFCGVAAGRTSAKAGAYYAHPGNRFWKILAETGLTPRLLSPGEFKNLPKWGIGLTDLAKSSAGPDTEIAHLDYDRTSFIDRIRAAKPMIVAFNGKKAAAEFYRCKTAQIAYGEAKTEAGFPIIHVLPSTSGSASGYWDPSAWHALAQKIQDQYPVNIIDGLNRRQGAD